MWGNEVGVGWSSSLKGQFTPKSRMHIFPLAYMVLFIHLESFGVSCCRVLERCLPSLEFNRTLSACSAEVPKNTQQQRFFPEIMAWFCKIIHRPCCEDFHVGATFFLVGKKVVPGDFLCRKKVVL